MNDTVLTQNPEPGLIIETQNLQRVYNLGKRSVYALRGVDLQILPERFVALKGRSGSGKTTLLNCIGGLDRPSGGVVRVFGRDLAELGEDQLALWRRKELGFVFQTFGLLPSLSVYENVDLMLRLVNLPRGERRERTMHCIELVDLKKWMDHRPHELSGGQQQRVGIARALANHPKLILADEPTGELDSNTTREILRLFRQIVETEHITILMSSHDPLSDEYVDQIYLLKDGQISTSKLVQNR
ncbi:MAG: ABC transporter ATP-binding protein [Anaerolineales bacterium]|jgi:putative ABC transport system ATP-binding protein